MDVKPLLTTDWDFIKMGIYESFPILFGNDLTYIINFSFFQVAINIMIINNLFALIEQIVIPCSNIYRSNFFNQELSLGNTIIMLNKLGG